MLKMNEKQINRYLRREFRTPGWLLVAYFGLMNVMVMVGMIGDMLKTDILAGNNAGVSSILVLSGGTDEAKLVASDIRPTYVFKNIRALLTELEK